MQNGRIVKNGLKRLEENLYLDSGYLNIREILWGTDSAFVLLAQGRGTGKTYGALEMVMNDEIPTIYMRRTQIQHDFITNPDYSPFQPVCEDYDVRVLPYKSSKFTANWCHSFYDVEKNKWYPDPDREPVCISTSLTAVHNVRGIDASKYKLLFYDEFIPEKHEKKIRDEGGAFLNAYETLNRNRELKGEPPLKALLCSNSNQLSNPIFEAFGLVDLAEGMKKKGRQILYLPEKSVTVFLLNGSRISKKKAQTALYKAASDERFKSMALENDFAYDTPTTVKFVPPSEYKPLAYYRGLSFNIHKGGEYYYISRKQRGGCKNIYEETEKDRIRFLREQSKFLDAYLSGKLIFESYSSEITFKKIFLEKA